MIRSAVIAAPAPLLPAACGNLSGAGAAGVPDVEPGEISIETMKAMTRTLSLDEFDGRMPGTPGEDKTLAYLVEIEGSNHGPLTVTGKDANLKFRRTREEGCAVEGGC